MTNVTAVASTVPTLSGRNLDANVTGGDKHASIATEKSQDKKESSFNKYSSKDAHEKVSSAGVVSSQPYSSQSSSQPPYGSHPEWNSTTGVPAKLCPKKDGSMVIVHPSGQVICIISSRSANLGSLVDLKATAIVCAGEVAMEAASRASSAPSDDDSVSTMGSDASSLVVSKKRHLWTDDEDALLRKGVDQYGVGKKGAQMVVWNKIARKYFRGNRTAKQCKNRYDSYVAPGMKRGKFTAHEDRVIIQGVKDKKNWNEISALLGTRSSKSIQQRYVSKLDPTLNHGPWTPREVEILTEARKTLGNKWTKIAKLLPGRSENMCKNRWSTDQKSLRRKIIRKAKESEAAQEIENARKFVEARIGSIDVDFGSGTRRIGGRP